MAEFVLSSTSPVVLAWWRESQARFDGYRAAMLCVRTAFPDRPIYDRDAFGGGRGIAALGGTSSPGAAWRRGRDGWVPRKDARKDPELLEMWRACRVTVDPTPGMAREVWGDYDSRTGATKVHQPGFHMISGELWCTWARQPDMTQVDLDLWTVRKLSAYYLAREQESESPTSDGGAT